MNIARPRERDFLMHVRREDYDGELIGILEGNRQQVEELLHEFGVLIFKGYGVDRADELGRTAQAFSKNLLGYNERAAPRTEVQDRVYTSTEFPKEETIPLHHEMAYSYNYPGYLYFCCALPSEEGGVTPVADGRVIIQRIPKAIQEELVSRKIMYVRNFGMGVDMSWQTAFQTTSKAEVERYLTANGAKFTWHGEKRLETQFIVDPIIRHPRTGEPVWFNHAHLFHSSNLPEDVREALVEQFTERGLPRNVFFGDGEPIPDEHLETIRNIYSSNCVGEKWEKGDFMLIDNLRASHGRTPYRGARQIYVCMSDLLSRDGTPTRG